MTDAITFLALRWAPAVDREYGLLFHKLDKWVKRYGCLPARKGMLRLIKNLRADLKRSATKVRTKDGELRGRGVGVTMVSMDEEVETKEGKRITLMDTLPDETPPPNYDWRDLIVDLHPRHQVIIERLLEGYLPIEVAAEFGLSNERIRQIKARAVKLAAEKRAA